MEDIWNDVFAGIDTSFAINIDCSLWGCGNNQYGKLGLGDTLNRQKLTKIGTKSWKYLSPGLKSTLAIDLDGYLFGCGNNFNHQLGNGTYNSPTIFTKIGTKLWNTVSHFSIHTLGIDQNGYLFAWGDNTHGQNGLGDDGNSTPIVGHWEPYQIGTDKWIYISAGHLYSFAIRSDGTLWSCGINTNGQLGLGDTYERHTFTQVGTDTDWIKVSSGYNHTIATKSNGTVWACGNNANGEIGLSDLINITTFRQVSANNVSDINSGEYHSIILESTDSTSLWTTDNFLGYFIVNQEIEPIDISIPGNNNTYTILNNNTNLSLSGGILSGTPTITGQTSIVIRVTDHNNNKSDRTFTIHGATLPVWNIPPQLTSMNINLLDNNWGHSDHSTGFIIPTATKGVHYSYDLIVSSYKSAPTNWQSGMGLPPGLNLNGELATLSGIPTGTPGWFNFSLDIYIGSKYVGKNAYSIFIKTIPVWQTKQLLPCAYNGINYNTTLVATDETLNEMTYYVKSGSKLPSGLTLNSASGVLSGIPTISGTVKFIITASNTHGNVDREFTYFTKTLPVWKTNSCLIPGEIGVSYSTFIYANDSDQNDKITYYLKNGSSLPVGLSITPSNNGVILSGTPSIETQDTTFILIAVDLYGGSSEKTFLFTLNKNLFNFNLTNIKVSIIDVNEGNILYGIAGLPSGIILTIHPLSPNKDITIIDNLNEKFPNLINEIFRPMDEPNFDNELPMPTLSSFEQNFNIKLSALIGNAVQAAKVINSVEKQLPPNIIQLGNKVDALAERGRNAYDAYRQQADVYNGVAQKYNEAIKNAPREEILALQKQLQQEKNLLDARKSETAQLKNENRDAYNEYKQAVDQLDKKPEQYIGESALVREPPSSPVPIPERIGNVSAWILGGAVALALGGAGTYYSLTIPGNVPRSPMFIDKDTDELIKDYDDAKELNQEGKNNPHPTPEQMKAVGKMERIAEELNNRGTKQHLEGFTWVPDDKAAHDKYNEIWKTDLGQSKYRLPHWLEQRADNGNNGRVQMADAGNIMNDGSKPYEPQPIEPTTPPPPDDIRNPDNPDYVPPPNPGDFGQPDWTDTLDNPLTEPGWQREQFIDGIDDYPDKSLENEIPNSPPPDVGQFNVGGALDHMNNEYNSGFYSNNGGNGNSGGSGSGGNGNGGNGDNGSGDNGNGGGQYFSPPDGPSTPGDIPGGPDQNPGCNVSVPEIESIGDSLMYIDALWECCEPCNGPPPEDDSGDGGGGDGGGAGDGGTGDPGAGGTGV